MLGANKIFIGLLAVNISRITIALPIAQPTQAQTRSHQQQIQELLNRASQLREQGESQAEIATYQQVLSLGRQFKDREAEAIALQSLGFVYQNIGQPRQSLASSPEAPHSTCTQVSVGMDRRVTTIVSPMM